MALKRKALLFIYSRQKSRLKICKRQKRTEYSTILIPYTILRLTRASLLDKNVKAGWLLPGINHYLSSENRYLHYQRETRSVQRCLPRISQYL